MPQRWKFWIDVGGTFTDSIAVSPDGRISTFKTLSSGTTKGTVEDIDDCSITDSRRCHDPDGFWNHSRIRLLSVSGETVQSGTVEQFDAATGRLKLSGDIDLSSLNVSNYELSTEFPAPVLAIRWLLRLTPHQTCPAVSVRFGTTRGTNALLTRNGARTALITTKGFGDVSLIGNQDRPDLFTLDIQKPEPLFSKVFEVDERISSDGTVLKPLNVNTATNQLTESGLIPQNFDSVAICLLNSYSNPTHEEELERCVRDMTFTEVSRSTDVSPLIRIVPRCDTTVLDAYLNPVLRTYMDKIQQHLPGSDIRVMTSTGGLTASDQFRGRDCILSGPAGGIVGFSKVAEAEGFGRSIGFDMGGTSTDVARYDGKFEYEHETVKAGTRILAPVLAIETVAAGGGSICGFDGVRLFVGPQSAGADPGPACYGSGGPLTVTDLNVFLGRVLPDHFPFQLDREAVRNRLTSLHREMIIAGVSSKDNSLHEIAEGLLRIANDNMVQAIRRVSVAKGYHPADYVLVSFGGAGSQHACSVARSLGIKKVLIHPFAGILSAYGMGQASVRAIEQRSVLMPLNENGLHHVMELRDEAETQTTQQIVDQRIDRLSIAPAILTLHLRYKGTDSTIDIAEPVPDCQATLQVASAESFREQFEAEHQTLFGYTRPDREIEIASIQIESVAHADESDTIHSETKQSQSDGQLDTTITWFEGIQNETTVIHRNQLFTGQRIEGPAIVCEPTSTIWIEPGCHASVTASGALLLTISDQSSSLDTRDGHASPQANPVLLEVLNNQYVSIAEQMGEMLRRTSTSTNVRERLDYSCALFDSDGQLVVNAPHVPVHLGAMGETVRAIIDDHAGMKPGDVFVTNDPYRGGSHLPDITVVTPVFCQPQDGNETGPAFFVANRAHHAEVGGIVPGSMPPFSTDLREEGVLIRSRKLVDGGSFCEKELRELLSNGPYPGRAVDDNIADLSAQVAANESGTRLLRLLVEQYSVETVMDYMKHIQEAAARKMRQCLSHLEDKTYQFTDELDDGTSIRIAITIDGDRATVDFSGTGPIHSGNLNANRAITTAAVLYTFRCLLNEEVPLNAGVLDPVELIIPPGLLNPKPRDDGRIPAIVGGNVETSQRIVDVLMGALGLAAASQGTMNNLTFGDDSFGYYETICGGSGATKTQDGADAVHTHMTNTRLTDPEVLEHRYPVRLNRFSIREDSGGAGQHTGGNGIVREIEFLKPLHVSMLSQRRGDHQPYGINGGQPGDSGRNQLRPTAGAEPVDAGGAFAVTVQAGAILTIETPGGGGFGKANHA